MTEKSRIPRQKADWQEVHRRLAQVAATLAQDQRISPERAAAELEKRARDLALVPPQLPRAAERVEVITFALADERYAVETRYVREVLKLTGCTPVPGAPEFLLGVMNVRGEILAVLDLRQLFGLPRPEATDRTRVLVLGVGRAEFGLLADAAHEVRTLRTDDLLDPPDSVSGNRREYLRGVTAEALIVLDGAVLLRDQRLFIDQSEEMGV
jgi:purine-binding chemotaxis protein CheW